MKRTLYDFKIKQETYYLSVILSYFTFKNNLVFNNNKVFFKINIITEIIIENKS